MATPPTSWTREPCRCHPSLLPSPPRPCWPSAGSCVRSSGRCCRVNTTSRTSWQETQVKAWQANLAQPGPPAWPGWRAIARNLSFDRLRTARRGASGRVRTCSRWTAPPLDGRSAVCRGTAATSRAGCVGAAAAVPRGRAVAVLGRPAAARDRGPARHLRRHRALATAAWPDPAARTAEHGVSAHAAAGALRSRHWPGASRISSCGLVGVPADDQNPK